MPRIMSIACPLALLLSLKACAGGMGEWGWVGWGPGRCWPAGVVCWRRKVCGCMQCGRGWQGARHHDILRQHGLQLLAAVCKEVLPWP